MNPPKLRKTTMCVLAILVKLIPQAWLDDLQEKYRIQTRAISLFDQVVALIVAQLEGCLSLRDLVTELRVHASQLAQIRRCNVPSRNGLAHANAVRPSSVMAEMFFRFIRMLGAAYPAFFRTSRVCQALPRRMRSRVLAVDSSEIDHVAKALADGTDARTKGGVKVHAVVEVRSMMPQLVVVSPARIADVAAAPGLCAPLGKGDIAILDRGYLSFGFLRDLARRGVRWVTRAKSSTTFRVVGQLAVDADIEDPAGRVPWAEAGDCHVVFDAKVILSAPKTSKLYPEPMRLVIADVPVRKQMRRLAFLTDHLRWPPGTVCQLYRSRWTIEAFFKQLKQTLQLRAFFGTGENAVRWQIWAALFTYVLCRLIAWRDQWQGAFSGFVALLRSILWSYFDLTSAVRNWHLGRDRRPVARPPPPRQPLLPGLGDV